MIKTENSIFGISVFNIEFLSLIGLLIRFESRFVLSPAGVVRLVYGDGIMNIRNPLVLDAAEAATPTAFWRFHDLKRLGIVSNRMTLWRWTKEQGFPEGVLLGPNTRAYPVSEVGNWLESRKPRKSTSSSEV